MLVSFTDSVEIRDAREVEGGYLVFDAPVARVGVYDYLASELGLGDTGMVSVLRPEASVFDKKSMASLAHKPVTDNHPAEDVTSKNWRDLGRGWVEGTVARDGDHIRVPLMIADADTISAVKAGKRELSPGYRAEITAQDGVHEGKPYTHVMGPPRYNHLAIVDKARGGSSCRLGDAWPTSTTPSKPQPGAKTVTTRTMIVDGLSVEVTDQAALAIEKLQKSLTDAGTAHAAAISAKDTQIGTLTAQTVTDKATIEDLTKKLADAALTPAKLDAAVKDRAQVITDASRIMGSAFDASGKTDSEIRRAVIDAKVGDAAKGFSDEAVTSAFIGLAAVAPKDGFEGSDPIVEAVRDSGNQSVQDWQTDWSKPNPARAKMLDNIRNPHGQAA